MSSPIQPYNLVGETATVTLDGSGNGTARWTPGAAGAPGSGVGAARNSGYTAAVDAVAVGVATNVKEAQCSVFLSWGVQSATQSDFLGQTATGSTGDTCGINQTLKPQDWITAKWTGGDAGQIATMRILGTITPPGSI